MLQWFNKQGTSSSPNERQEENPQYSPASASDLTDEDYEFLFNQLLDGIAHGWHLGRIIKFFDNLQTRSNPERWIVWLEKFEQKIVYSADPSQRRVGAIMMRFGELTQSNDELRNLGAVFHRIGKKLLIGETKNLILEYDGLDRVIEENDSTANIVHEEEAPLSSLESDTIEQNVSASLKELEEFTEEPELSPGAENQEITIEQSLEAIQEVLRSEEELSWESAISSTEQATHSEDLSKEEESLSAALETEEELVIEEEESIESLESLTEQLTVLQDATSSLETAEISQPVTEEFKESTDFNPELTEEDSVTSVTDTANLEIEEEVIEEEESIESLEALTEQLTVLQDDSPQTNLPSENSENTDSENTLVAPNTDTYDSSTSLSVASFLEATKALVPQKENPITPLTWEEFVVALEQDRTLAQQVAQHLQIATTDPHEIVEAAVNRLNKQESITLSPETIASVENWFNLGLKQASAEDFQGAIASWDKALELNPNLSEAWHNRGSALGRLEKYEEAIHSFNQAIGITPGRYQAWNDRAHALYQIEKWEQAVESWDKAISIVSDNYQFWYNRGCALEQLERFEESISSYEKTLEIKPDFQPARSRYISLVTEQSP